MSGASSPFPIQIIKTHMLHRGGTKFYEILRVENAIGASMVIWRWGRKGTQGQHEIFTFDKPAKAVKAFNDKENERDKRGYSPVETKTITAADEAELKTKIGLGLFYKLGKDTVEFIAPGADTKGVREPEPPAEWQPDPLNPGEFINANPPKPRTIREPTLEEVQAKTHAEKIKSDPLWGSW